MNNNKSSHKAKISLILIVVFTFALLALILLEAWRNNASSNLDVAVTGLKEPNTAINLTDNSIQKFFSIENSFRLYTATGQEEYRIQYSDGLKELKVMLDSIERSINKENEPDDSLSELLKKKSVEADIFLRLKLINDSLMMATNDLKNFAIIGTPVFKPISKEEANNFIQRTTIVVADQKPQKKLLGRLKDAISNKRDSQATTITTSVNKIDNETSEQNDLTHKALNDLLSSSISKLTYSYKKLSENEKRLILSNSRLLTKLSSILKELKQLESELHSLRINQLKEDAQISLNELSYIHRIILLVGVLLALVILINAWQLYVHDKKLVAAKDQAVRQTHARGDFLAHMSHEIRTPLNSILGFSEQLENSSLNNSQKDQVLSIRQSSKILLSIVNDILDLAKFETGNINLHINNFYPEKTIKHVVSSLKILADKKSISLKCNSDVKADFMLAGDEYRLKQVLINLINNAIKFTEAGNVTVTASVNNNTLFVEVADTGRGIPAENLNSIFDEFSQITKSDDKERHNGSGLGLAICKKIINAQGGKISVKSEFAKGSVFSFSIPYSASRDDLETSAKTELKPTLDTTLFTNKYVLIAEDDKMNIKLIQTIFNKWGLRFDVVESGNKAYELFQKNRYDIILTDIHMPDGDGLWLTKKIREYPDESRSTVPILAITANALQKDLNEYEAIGINDNVVKPFTEERLFEKIRQNLRFGV